MCENNVITNGISAESKDSTVFLRAAVEQRFTEIKILTMCHGKRFQELVRTLAEILPYESETNQAARYG